MSLLVKNIIKKNKSSTTITVKVTEEFKKEWDTFCLNNNVNKSKTL